MAGEIQDKFSSRIFPTIFPVQFFSLQYALSSFVKHGVRQNVFQVCKPKQAHRPRRSSTWETAKQAGMYTSKSATNTAPGLFSSRAPWNCFNDTKCLGLVDQTLLWLFMTPISSENTWTNFSNSLANPFMIHILLLVLQKWPCLVKRPGENAGLRLKCMGYLI